MDSSLKELSRYRYYRSVEELTNAKDMLNTGKYKLALNRSYYCIFHGMRAVNILDEFDSSKHSGVIAHFNQYHVKTEDFPREASRIIRSASEMREHADYDNFSLLPGRRRKSKSKKYFINRCAQLSDNVPDDMLHNIPSEKLQQCRMVSYYLFPSPVFY